MAWTTTGGFHHRTASSEDGGQKLDANFAKLGSGNLAGIAVTALSFSGSGAALTALNASNVASGTLADARLSSNVPLKDAANTFTAAQTFSAAIAINAMAGLGSGGYFRGGSNGFRFNNAADSANLFTVTDAGDARLGDGTPTSGVGLEVRRPSAVASIWCLGGTGSGHYAQLLFGEGVNVGEYMEAVRFSNASGDAGRFVLSNLNKSILFSTSYSGGYRADLLLTAAGNVELGGSLKVGGGTAVARILSATATLDFGSTAAQTSADLTVSVTGAAVGDSVVVTPPAAPAANTSFSAWVSAADTVTVRHNNYSAGAVDPASGTYRVTVLKF